VDVNALVLSMDGLLRQAINEQIRLDFALADPLPSGSVDPNELESAILNLAINARDAMPTGGTLTIATAVVDVAASAEAEAERPAGAAPVRPGRYVVVSVGDTGVGMPPEVIDKAFDPFFTTKPLGQGTGLGLSMVYGFARQSGGQVRIESRPGEGTSVRIYLPATSAAPALDDMVLPASVDGAGERVLVVEDDAAVRMLVREVLEELHYAPVEFADPLAALPYLASDQRIDLMISDVGMPGMNGRELAEKARGHRPGLPILFVTGYAENAAIRAGFLGANMAMVAKPFTLESLAGKITEMINAR
jgi:CheY-like chemotaxis protein